MRSKNDSSDQRYLLLNMPPLKFQRSFSARGATGVKKNLVIHAHTKKNKNKVNSSLTLTWITEKELERQIRRKNKMKIVLRG